MVGKKKGWEKEGKGKVEEGKEKGRKKGKGGEEKWKKEKSAFSRTEKVERIGSL